jgi:hypothetical protein
MNLEDAETHAGIRNFGIREFGGNSVRRGYAIVEKLRDCGEPMLEVHPDLLPPSISLNLL